MAYYNNRQEYASPQSFQSQGYGRQEGYGVQPQRNRDPAYSQLSGGGVQSKYQNEEAYRNNQQFTEKYGSDQQQYINHDQRAQVTNPEGAIPNGYYNDPQQGRTYQYDERYRANGRGVAQRGGRGQYTGQNSPPRPRPGTSASDRRPRIERILDPAEESPKAVAWDNPFGVFPGTKKDVEEKRKKQEGDERDRSKAGTPSSIPPPAQDFSPPQRPGTSDAQAPKIMTFEEHRPNTSHSRKPLPSQARAPTSGSRENSSGVAPPGRLPFQGSIQQGDWTQTDPRVPRQNDKGMLILPERPAEHRSASGPIPQRQHIAGDNTSVDRTQGRDQTRRYISDGNEQNNARRQRDKDYPLQDTLNRSDGEQWGSMQGPPQTGHPTMEEDSRRQQYPRNGHRPDKMPAKGYGELGYGGMPSAAANITVTTHDMPDFATMSPDATADVERDITLQTAQPYRKPTYRQVSSKPPLNIRSPAEETIGSAYSDGSIRSPVYDSQYDFPGSGPQQRQAPSQGAFDSGYDSRNRYQQPRRRDTEQQYPDGNPNAPRSGSQSDVRNARPPNSFSHPYNQPPRSQQRGPSGQAAPGMRPRRSEEEDDSCQYASRQEYGFDDRGYPLNYNHDQGDHPQDARYSEEFSRQGQYQERPQIQRTFTAPVDEYEHDQYNHGYHQPPPSNGQSAQGDIRHQSSNQPYAQNPELHHESGRVYNQNKYTDPARPRTANSARTPVRQNYEDFPLPAQSRPGLPDSDRAHPIPVRPGLMMPAPPSGSVPTATSKARGNEQMIPPHAIQQIPQGPPQAPAPRNNAPVTLKELNELREAFKTRPNDSQLGLKFAKRLVEAAKVLSSEGGRADPKQTAKNRERYINDAYRIVKKLVASGSGDAMFYLADCYGQGLLGLAVDPKEAFALYTSAAKIGHAQSAYRVAVCCELGHQEGGGTRRDHVKAVQFYKRAATLGDPPAMYKMGMVLLKGLLGQQTNPREGISWLKRAAERADEENPHALHELGLLYESAKSTDVILRDEAYALQLFNSAAKLGYKYSQHRLGSAYEYGTLGCPIDPRQSIHWYSEAAKQHEHQSEFALSGWYLTGSPPLLEQSDTEAYLWARKAATSGLGKAEYAMGYYTEVGIGVKPDVEEAKKWYFRAAAQGDMRARERLEELKRGAGRRKRDRVSRSDVDRKNEGDCNVM